MGIDKHHNVNYNGSVPYRVGDRYYSQDRVLDFRFLQDLIGLMGQEIIKQSPVRMIGGIVSQGGGLNLNITAGRGFSKKSVEIPDSFGSVPPSKTTGDLENQRVEWNTETNMNVSSANCSEYTVVDDGATVQYVKIAYYERDGNTRARAKSSGSYSYEVEPGYDFVINATPPTAYEICFASFTSSGGTYTITDYAATCLQDRIVTTQAEFNDCVIRTAANQYKFRDGIRSIYIKYLSGGYDCYGGSSFLSGGDSYGVLSLNNCASFRTDSGVSLNIGDTAFYLSMNCNNALLENVWLKGIGSSAVNVAYSFYQDAATTGLTLRNCKASNRSLQTSIHEVFQGQGDYSTRIENCSAIDMVTTYRINCCYNFYKVDGFIVKNIDATSGSGGPNYGISGCIIISNCIIDTYESSTEGIRIFHDNRDMSNCIVSNITSTTGKINIFSSCTRVSNCDISVITTTTGVIYAIEEGGLFSVCKFRDLNTTTGEIRGVYNSLNITGCQFDDFDTTSGNIYGMYTVDQVSGCYLSNFDSSSGGNVKGVYDLNCVSGLTVDSFSSNGSGVVYGTQTVRIGSSLRAINLTSVNGECVGHVGLISSSAIYASDITATGSGNAVGVQGGSAISSIYVASISANSGNAYGVFNADYLSACTVPTGITSSSGTAEGIKSCNYGSSLFSNIGTNSGNDWIDTVDTSITNKVSTPSVWT